MSTTIDQRVVEMRFENSNFERNVQTSMGTLEKLKQKLNLTGAAKGFETVNAAAKNVNMSGLGNAVETVRTKFSALEVMGVTALANITNSAVNAGKRIVSALTIDPITTGFNEYETKINSIQTIMSNTASKGTTMEDVTRVIDELNTYADKTIYNFSEMTRNIGTFTAAGVGLEDSAAAIQGIANLAAASGSNSQQASTAMYQLSQALAAGTVKLMDWNSVVNAGMGGEKFQEALKSTAREMGISVDSIIEKNGSFRDSLQDGWLTADVLNTTLKKFTKEGAKEYADAMVKSGKYTKEQADALLKEAQNMEDAATKVKTFTQLWNTLKESAQSGWGKTWELIFGDFEEARELFSNLSDFLGGFINKMSDFRNNLLEGALGSPFEKLSEKINKVTGATEAMTKVTKDYTGVVDKIINGEFGNGQERWDKLAEAGYDWAHAQNLVNEKLGSGVRHATNYKEAQNGVNESQATSLKQLVKMSDAQLKNLKFTDSEIKALRDLEEQSEKTGIPMDELIKDMDQLSGRSLLINSFKNAGQGLVAIFKAMKDAWVEIFPPMTSEQLYDIIASIHKFSTHLRVGDETADKLKRTLKGVFAALDIVTTILGGGLKFAIKVVSKLLGMADLDILDITASVGDMIVKFRDWIDENNFVMKGLEKLSPYLKKAGDAFKDWIDKLKDSDNIPRDIIAGLIRGLGEGVKLVIEAGVKMAKGLLDAVKDFLGIHSPSTEFAEVGKNIIEGLIEGIGDGAKRLYEGMVAIGSKLIDIIKNIDIGTIIAGGMLGGSLAAIFKITDVLSKFAAPLEGIGNMFEGVGDMFEGLGKSFKASAWEKKSKAMRNIAISIGILAASVYLLAQLKPGELWATIGAITAIGVVIVGLTVAVEKLSKLTQFNLKTGSVLAIALAILVIAFAMQQLAKINIDDMPKIALGLGLAVGSLIAVIGTIGLLIKDSKNISKIGSMFIKLGVALLIMVGVIKLISLLEPGEIKRGLTAIGLIGLIFVALGAVSKLAGDNVSKMGGMFLKTSIAMLIMVGVIKLISGLSNGEIKKGLGVITTIGLIFAALTAVSKLAGNNANKVGPMLLMMSGALLITTYVIKIISDLSDADIKKGLEVITTVGLIFAALIAVTKLAGNNAIKAGASLLMMSGAMLILSATIAILSKVNPEGLKRAVTAIVILGILFGGLIAVTKLAGSCEKELGKMIIAIGLLSAVLIALSFIKPEKLKNSVLAIVSVMGALALVIASTSLSKSIKVSQFIGMIAVVAAIATILGIMDSLEVEGSIQTATSIGILLTTMSASLLILSKTGSIGMTSIGALFLMGLVVAELAVILGLMSHFDVNPSIEIAASLSLLLISMSASLVLLGVVGTLGPAAFIGIGALATLIVGIGGLVTAIGALTQKFPALESFIDTGIPILQKIGYALGSFFGEAIGGLLGGLTSGLPDIADDLSSFMDKLQPFIDSASSIDESSLTGVKNLADMLLTLTKANILDSITSWITGESSLTSFAEQLVPFGKAMTDFSKIVSGNIDEGAVTAAANAGKIMAEMATEIPNSGGLLGFIVGENDMSTFGAQLVPFGKAMADFSSTVSGSIDEGAVTAAANAGKIMAEMATEIPNSGGLLGFIVGENDMSTFGAQLKSFGGAMVSFSKTISGNIDEGAVTAAASAGKALAEMAATLPNSGGLISWFTGDNDMDDFGKQLKSFGGAMKSFSSAVSGIDVEAMINSATASKSLAELADNLYDIEWAAWLTGDSDMSEFGEQLKSFGTSLKNYSTAVSGIDTDAISASATAGKALSDMVKSMPKSGGLSSGLFGSGNASTFATGLVDLGRALKSYSMQVSGIDFTQVSTATSQFSKLASMVKNLSGVDFGGLKSFGTSLGTLGKAGVDKFVKAFQDAGDKTAKAARDLVDKLLKTVKSKHPQFTTEGSNIMKRLADGIVKSKSILLHGFISALAFALTSIRGQYASFYSAGSYLVDGMASGISANSYKVAAKARAMATAAKEAAEEALGINSPSRVFYAIGEFTGQGFINALNDYGSKSYNAGSEIADSARSGLSNAIGRITELINSDMETQPTIRPVLDLSNVQSGVGSLNNMLNLNPSMGVMANVGAINSMMNQRNQNGVNGDVVSAIDKLRGDLSNMSSGNTNIINGVTYDDGSNIADAVESIVRAARIERRI